MIARIPLTTFVSIISKPKDNKNHQIIVHCIDMKQMSTSYTSYSWRIPPKNSKFDQLSTIINTFNFLISKNEVVDAKFIPNRKTRKVSMLEEPLFTNFHQKFR